MDWFCIGCVLHIFLSLFFGRGSCQVLVEIADHTHETWKRHVVMRHRLIDTRIASFNALNAKESVPWTTLTTNEPYPFLVHVGKKLMPQEQEKLVGSTLPRRLQIRSYIPHHTYVIPLTVEEAQSLKQNNLVEWMGLLLPEDKLCKRLTSEHLNFSASHLDREIPSMCLNVDTLLEHETEQIWIRSLPFEYTVEQWSLDRFSICANHQSNVIELAKRLAEMSQILWVSLQPSTVKKHNKWSRPILNSGSYYPEAYTEGLLQERLELMGEGEIIGVGDSGLDVNHCMFQDPTASVPFVNYAAKPSRRPFSTSHRKIAQYVQYGDGIDEDGHGTHVSASVAGSPYTSNNGSELHKFSGMAPEAKLAFFDLGQVQDDGSVELRLPSGPLGERYFEWARLAGARIHSNSWGYSANEYTVVAQDVDLYMYTNQDFLILLSAGNDGENGPGSISSPSNAKNCLTVGATPSSESMFSEAFCAGGYDESSSKCAFYSIDERAHYNENNVAYFSALGPTHDGRLKPEVLAPGLFIYSARDSSSSCRARLGSQLDSKIGTSMSVALVSGTLAIVRQYFRDGMYPTGVKNKSHSINPSGALMKAMAISGANLLTGSKDLGTADGPAGTYVSLGNAPNSIQGFGRLELQRTIPARANSTKAFDLLIAGVNLQSNPIQKDYRITTGQRHDFKLCVVDDGPVKVTLVWTDLPAALGAGTALVNDLDLIGWVDVNESIAFAANGTQSPMYLPGEADEYYVGKFTKDRVNPFERLDWTNAIRGQVFRFFVEAANLPTGVPQAYALVVTGRLSSAVPNGTCNFTRGHEYSDFIVPNYIPPLSTLPANSQPSFATKAIDTIVDNLGLVLTGAIALLLFIGSCVLHRVRQNRSAGQARSEHRQHQQQESANLPVSTIDHRVTT